MSMDRYLTEKTNNLKKDGLLLYVSHSKYEHDWPSLVHLHHFLELFYIIGGKGTFTLNEEEYHVRTRDIIIVGANVSHAEKSSDTEPLEYLAIGVEDLVLFFENKSEYFVYHSSTNSGFYLQSMLTLYHEVTDKAEGYKHVCQSLLEALLTKLMRDCKSSYALSVQKQSGQDCQKIKRYIEANYMHNITLDTLSELTHLNKYYLVHIYTAHFGCSPISYLCRVRIQASKELLAHTDYSITEVAQSSGFSSQSYFAQSFYKSCGMTASAYRKAFGHL